MRLTPSVLFLSLISLAESVANAQLTGTSFPPLPGSNENYVMGFPASATTCQILTSASVTVLITEDLFVGSERSGGVDSAPNGFSLQLNANAPSSINNKQAAWQQYTIEVGGPNDDFETHTQPWTKVTGSNPTSKSFGESSGFGPALTPGVFFIPKGTSFTTTLQMAPDGKVTAAIYSIVDPQGTPYLPVNDGQPFATSGEASSELAPIIAFQLNIVGWGNGSLSWFAAGAGKITYTAAPYFEAQTAFPGCVSLIDGKGPFPATGETSNIEYEQLSLEQQFGMNTQISQKFHVHYNGGVFFGQSAGLKYSPTSPAAWMAGSDMGECAQGQPLMGISATTTNPPVAIRMYCEDVGSSSLYQQSSACHGQPFGVNRGGDNRSPASVVVDGTFLNGVGAQLFPGGDWDGRHYKDECAPWEFAAGVAQANPNDGTTELDSLLCCPFANETDGANHKECNVQAYDTQDSSGFTNSSQPDWDYGNFKGQCPDGQYVAGVSSDTNGAPHALLCCSPS
jgi:hypothetical protein